MTKEFFKTAVAGILAGVALFMIPLFLIKVIVFFLLIKAIFRLLGGRRRCSVAGMNMAFAHQFQNMNDDERKVFMSKFGKGCRNRHNTCAPDENIEKTTN